MPSSEIRLFTPKLTRQELQHYQGQTEISAQQIDNAGDGRPHGRRRTVCHRHAVSAGPVRG